MKLIIQIPCYNEESTLPSTMIDLPKVIDGVDIIEYLIVDDGSKDNTIEVARNLGVHHIVKFPNNRGLAAAFMAGIDASLRLGADIIVNTDGDNQYCGLDIGKLIKPILDGNAEIVIGDRQTDTIEHFSYIKKKLQKLGSKIVRIASNSNVTDATSGFRAYSRDAAMKLNVLSEYTYTLETIIEAGRRKVALENVKIRTNEKLRESRLFKSIWGYLKKSASTIIRTYVMLRPIKVFLSIGFILFFIGVLIAARFLLFFINGDGSGHIQSLILSSIMIVSGFQLSMFGLLADSISALRKINDQLLYRIKKIEYGTVNNIEYKINDSLKTQSRNKNS